MSTPSFLEEYISQIPAVELLLKSGYRYLSRDELNQQRAGKTSQAVLLDILTESAFYRLQSRILPDAEKRKFALEKTMVKAGQ